MKLKAYRLKERLWNNNKNREFSLDLIRSIAMGLVFLFHFMVEHGITHSFLFGRVNRELNIGTTLFLLLSGYCIQMRKYPLNTKADVFSFYKDRALRIFPLLWITFAWGYLTKVMEDRSFLYGGRIWKILLSFLGIDGYLQYFNVTNYCVIGEWYTAMILVLYLLYPFFHLCMRKWRGKTTGILIFIYLIYILLQIGPVPQDASIFYCALAFWLGMLFYEWNETIVAKRILILSLCAAGILPIMLVRLPTWGSGQPWKLCLAAGWFILIKFFFEKVFVNRNIRMIFQFQNNISYAFYLCHHRLIYMVPKWFSLLGIPFRTWKTEFLVVIIITEAMSIILYQFTRLPGYLKALKYE